MQRALNAAGFCTKDGGLITIRTLGYSITTQKTRDNQSVGHAAPYSANNSRNTSGRRLAIVSNDRAAPDG
jgi:hypothetical protein